MNDYLLILLVSLSYIVFFGISSLLRREGLSLQFAVEVLITMGVFLLMTAIGIRVHVILILFLIYLITMRARLIVDMANFWAKRGNPARANSLYRLALQLYPDKTSRLIVEINQGTNLLRVGELEAAKETLQAALQAGQLGGLGLKYEAACRYNLAVACRKLGQEAEALRQFNQVIDLIPGSPYGQAAQAALEKKTKQAESDTNH